MIALLRRGAAAGACSGLLTGLFGYLVAEPIIDRAVRAEVARTSAENAAAAAAGRPVAAHVDVYSRSTQHVGLLVAATVTGLCLGVLFAVVYRLVFRADPDRDSWSRALRLAAAGFAGVFLTAFLRYPANPPGVGDPGTIGSRTQHWLVAIAVGLLLVTAAWQLNSVLVQRHASVPARHSAVTLLLVSGAGLVFVLPADTDPLRVAPGLLWTFRLLSITSAALLWAGLGAAFGWLGQRSARPVTAPPGAVESGSGAPRNAPPTAAASTGWLATRF